MEPDVKIKIPGFDEINFSILTTNFVCGTTPMRIDFTPNGENIKFSVMTETEIQAENQ